MFPSGQRSPTFLATGFTEDNFSIDWVDGFEIIQLHYVYCALFSIIITLAPPQIIRHYILEVGDHCLRSCLLSIYFLFHLPHSYLCLLGISPIQHISDMLHTSQSLQSDLPLVLAADFTLT